MQNRTKNSILKYTQLTRQLIRHHFPKKSVSIKPLSGGLTNFVYAVHVGMEQLVVRISDKAEKIHFFQKEQWAVAKAKEKQQRHNVQYLGITFGVVALFITLLLMGLFKVSPKTIKILSFFSFLLFFEFIFVFITQIHYC